MIQSGARKAQDSEAQNTRAAVSGHGHVLALGQHWLKLPSRGGLTAPYCVAWPHAVLGLLNKETAGGEGTSQNEGDVGGRRENDI